MNAMVLEHKQLLADELSRLVEKLAARQDVEAVILYGSYASGSIDENSDLDFCVVQNTLQPSASARRSALLKFLQPHVPLDLTIYTPTEFRRFKRRWPFTRDQILGKGRVLFVRDVSLFDPGEPLHPEEERQIMIESYQDWLTHARQDLRAAKVLIHEELWNLVCFHSQQAVEKCLKGLIVRREHIMPPREHTIEKLVQELPPEWFSDFAIDLEYINEFYTSTRYPTAAAGELPDGPPGKQDSERALQIARQIVERTKFLASQLDNGNAS